MQSTTKSYAHVPRAEGIPLTFGTAFADDPVCRSSLRKSHALQRALPPLPLPGLPSPHTAYQYNGSAGWLSMFRKACEGDQFAAFLALPETELRFLAYLRETLPDGASGEKVRIRKVRVDYFPADDSWLVREAKTVNSGMSEGVMLHRRRVPRPGGKGDEDVMTLADIEVGGTITLYGQTYHVVDADEATRKILSEKGLDVPPALPWPTEEDTHGKLIRASFTHNPRRSIPTSEMDHKRIAESLISGGSVSKHPPDEVRRTQQFHRHGINEHLSFAALWDDRDSFRGDLRHVVVRYYLESDAVEIVEQRLPNSGREGGRTLLVKQRIARPENEGVAVQHNPYGMQVRTGYYEAQDLDIGLEIPIYGRRYFLYDADPFTRRYFENLGRPLGPPLDVKDIVHRFDRPTKEVRAPPHNGYGRPEDSLQNCLGLQPKPPRVDMARRLDCEGMVYVFEAELIAAADEVTEGREFIISLYPARDELEVVERCKRNSGIVGGTFLKRSRYVHRGEDGNDVPYTPKDFAVGSTVTIFSRTFRIVAIDERTAKLLRGDVEPPTSDRITALRRDLIAQLEARFLRAHEAMRRCAPNGWTAQELQKFFAQCSNRITLDEASQLLAAVCPEGNGVLTLAALHRLLGTAIRAADVALDPDAPRSMTETQRSAAAMAERRRLARELRDKLEQRRCSRLELFRMISQHDSDGVLRPAALRISLRDVLHMQLSERDEAIVIDNVFGGRGYLTMQNFSDMLDS